MLIAEGGGPDNALFEVTCDVGRTQVLLLIACILF